MDESAPLPSGSEPVDDLLGGGYERGTVTQVYGPPASGKTTLAVTAAVATAVDGGTALYIDTEGLSLDRLEQVAAARAPEGAVEAVIGRVMLSAAHDFDEQREAIREAATVAPEVELIVVDSVTGFYRLERAEEAEEDAGDALRDVGDQVAHLLGLARRHDLATIVTNQVFTDPDADAIRPLGGYTLEHWSGTVLRLERFRGGNRRLRLEKHRARPDGDAVTAEITDRGLVGRSGP